MYPTVYSSSSATKYAANAMAIMNTANILTAQYVNTYGSVLAQQGQQLVQQQQAMLAQQQQAANNPSINGTLEGLLGEDNLFSTIIESLLGGLDLGDIGEDDEIKPEDIPTSEIYEDYDNKKDADEVYVTAHEHLVACDTIEEDHKLSKEELAKAYRTYHQEHAKADEINKNAEILAMIDIYRFDKDGDGKLNGDELADRLAYIDADKDGEYMDNINDFLTSMSDFASGTKAWFKENGGADGNLDDLDLLTILRREGDLDKKDREKALETNLALWDKDKSGTMDLEEFFAQSVAMDKNKDGKISESENTSYLDMLLKD